MAFGDLVSRHREEIQGPGEGVVGADLLGIPVNEEEAAAAALADVPPGEDVVVAGDAGEEDIDAADGGGVAVAHAGTSTAHLARFGVGVRAARVVTRMEESWTIDDVAFNVPGLGPDAFIPPEEVRRSRSYGAAIAAGK